MDLIALIDRWGLDFPDRPAHVNRRGVMTYSELIVRSNAVASSFARDLPADPTPVALLGHKEHGMLVGFVATLYYNEPGAMKQYALDLGIPDEAIVQDYVGRRTYDTCYRARDIFGVHEAILVTQGFHLPRALYTCNQLGVKAVGGPADLRPYLRRAMVYWNLREIPATFRALWEVHLTRPLPILGNPEPIFPKNAQ